MTAKRLTFDYFRPLFEIIRRACQLPRLYIQVKDIYHTGDEAVNRYFLLHVSGVTCPDCPDCDIIRLGYTSKLGLYAGNS